MDTFVEFAHIDLETRPLKNWDEILYALISYLKDFRATYGSSEAVHLENFF